MVAPLIERRLTLVGPKPVYPGLKATPDQIKALKRHMIACASHVNQVKARMAMSQRALAALPIADVEAAVVPGYPPPAV